MPVTMLRVNIVEGIGPVIQIAEGYTCNLDDGRINGCCQCGNCFWSDL